MSAVRTLTRVLIAIVAFLALPLAAHAQHQERVGFVVAVVGDSVILNYDIEEDVFRTVAQSQQPPPQGAALERLRRQLLEARIDQLVILQAAARDTSIRVDQSTVDAAVQQEIQRRQRALGGPAQLEAALRQSGLSMQEFRNQLTQQIRRERLIQAYVARQQQSRRPPPVTEAEMQRYLAENRERLGERPATVVFEQVVVPVTPSDSALARARAKADSIFAMVIRGDESFETLARRFSEDPGSRDLGGDLGYFREGVMVREFSNAAFSMRPGQVSPPILTSFGYHIIKLERIRGAERQARHILIRPEISEEDSRRARALADSIIAQLRNGADIDSLIARYGDRDEQSRIGPHPLDQLPEPYLTALANASTGDIVGPLELAGSTQQKWAVVQVVNVQQSGEYTLDDTYVRTQVRRLLEQEKLLQEIVEELRRRTFIDVRVS
jgi:peptidyl-prolyl cis-trans isomerase SurA